MTEEILTMLLLRGFTSKDTSLNSDYYTFTKDTIHIDVFIRTDQKVTKHVLKINNKQKKQVFFAVIYSIEELLEELGKYE